MAEVSDRSTINRAPVLTLWAAVVAERLTNRELLHVDLIGQAWPCGRPTGGRTCSGLADHRNTDDLWSAARPFARCT